MEIPIAAWYNLTKGGVAAKRPPRLKGALGRKNMEGFTVTLALVDAIPVLLFGASMILVAGKFGHPLFIVGAVISTLAGCMKVAWKLCLGIWKKDLRWLNKPFVPLQCAGFLLMLVSFVLGFGSIRWGAVGSAIFSFPAVIFFVGWLGLMGFMGWFRKNKFKNDDSKSNWTAQLVNCLGQACLLLGILLAL